MCYYCKISLTCERRKGKRGRICIQHKKCNLINRMSRLSPIYNDVVLPNRIKGQWFFPTLDDPEMRLVAHHSANVPQQNNGQVSSSAKNKHAYPIYTNHPLIQPLPTLGCTTEASQLPYRPIRIHYTIELIPVIITEFLRKQGDYKYIKTMCNTRTNSPSP